MLFISELSVKCLESPNIRLRAKLMKLTIKVADVLRRHMKKSEYLTKAARAPEGVCSGL